MSLFQIPLSRAIAHITAELGWDEEVILSVVATRYLDPVLRATPALRHLVGERGDALAEASGIEAAATKATINLCLDVMRVQETASCALARIAAGNFAHC